MVTNSGSLVQLCCGEGGALQISLACVGSARGLWTTLDLLQLAAACAFRVYTGQVPGCSAGVLCCPKQTQHFVHLSGLSCSGSASRVLHKGTDWVGRAFGAFPGFEQLRRPGAL